VAALASAPAPAGVQDRLWLEAIYGGKAVPPGQTAAAINGHPARLFYDTGVGAPIVLSEDYAKAIGLALAVAAPEHVKNPIPGKPEVGFSVPCELTYFGVSTKNLMVPVFALPRAVPRADGIFEGMVGWPTMRGSLWSFALADGQFSQISAVPAAAKSWQQFQIWDEDNTLSLIPPSDPRGVERIIVDTGNPSGVELPPDQWKEWLAQHPNAPMTLYMDYLPGQKIRLSYESFAETFPLGTIVLHKVPVSEADPTYYAVQAEPGEKIVAIGLAAFARMEVMLDPPNDTAYLRVSGSPAPPYLHNRMGAAYYPRSRANPDLIATVVPNDPAALAGIRDGDALVRIDGQSTERWRNDAELLKRMGGRVPAGTRVVYTVRRGTEMIEVPVVARDILK